MSAPAAEHNSERRVAKDSKSYTWRQFLQHYGTHEALWFWNAATVEHSGGDATEHVDQDDKTLGGVYGFLSRFAFAYVGDAMTNVDIELAVIETILGAAKSRVEHRQWELTT